jgi:integrase
MVLERLNGVQKAAWSKYLTVTNDSKITFYMFRDWKATMEYHKTKNRLQVQKVFGHKSISSTMIYTHLVNFEADEYHTATSKSLKRDEELLMAGFEYVTERDEIKIFRKRK